MNSAEVINGHVRSTPYPNIVAGTELPRPKTHTRKEQEVDLTLRSLESVFRFLEIDRHFFAKASTPTSVQLYPNTSSLALLRMR